MKTFEKIMLWCRVGIWTVWVALIWIYLITLAGQDSFAQVANR